MNKTVKTSLVAATLAALSMTSANAQSPEATWGNGPNSFSIDRSA